MFLRLYTNRFQGFMYLRKRLMSEKQAKQKIEIFYQHKKFNVMFSTF